VSPAWRIAPMGARLRRLWNLTSRQCTSTFKGPLATGFYDNTARVWDVASMQCTATLEGHPGWVKSVAFSPYGCSLATGSDDNTARVWELGSGQCCAILKDQPSVLSVSFSPNGHLLATGSWVWDVASMQFTATLEGHSGYVNNVALSPDGRLLVTGSWDKTAGVWDLANGQ
jgi:uncharacterized protein with WD repeat